MTDFLNTVDEAMPKLTLSRSGVYDLCRRNLIRHVRVGAGGAGIRIPDSAIAEYLASRTVGVGAGGPKAPRPSGGGPFTMLDGDRLREAWAKR